LDYLATGKDKDLLRTQMQKECSSFKIIDRIAHALKHKASAGNMKVEDVVERPPANWGEAVWGISRWGDGVGGVTLNSNPEIDLLNELNATLSHLGNQLPALEDSWIKSIQLFASKDARIAKVFVFGSRAKGTHRYDSDLDIAVQLTGTDPSERDTYAICKSEKWRKELGAVLPIKLDLQWANPETDKTVWPAVLNHGVQIFPISG
jgi:predicted nucleotidyltransferase